MSATVLLHAAKTGEAAKAGPIGLAVILILAIACYFLFKSMSRHMRNVRENFPADGSVDERGKPTGAGTPRATPVARQAGAAPADTAADADPGTATAVDTDAGATDAGATDAGAPETTGGAAKG